MNKQILLASLCLVLGLTGCSKAKPAQPTSAATTATNNDTPQSAGAVDLKIKWRPGKKYLLRFETLQNTIVPAPGKPPAKTTVSLSHDYVVSVAKELPGGGQELDWKLVAQKFQYQMGGVSMLNFDSAEPVAQDAGNYVAPILRKLIGAKLTCQTDASGRFVKIEGFKELTTRMSGGNRQISAMIKEYFNEDNMKQVLDFFQMAQPDHPVLIGDSWPVHIEIKDFVGLMVVDATEVLKEKAMVEGRSCANIDFNGHLTSKSAPTGAPAPYEIENGTLSGRISIDPELSMAVKSTCETHSTLKPVKPTGAPSVELNQTTNVRLVEVTDL